MALRAALGRGDRGAGAKELESLDICIQHTLSALYPPFEATAATVLWQLFSVAEKLYRGDGLRCLTDFLIPARRALQHLQQEACARYTGLLFLHEGWPLCIHEKVVVQLASLRGVRLRPGDFYLQITAAGRQSARLVLKCLSRLGRGSEEVAVPEAMYGCVFTGEFLELVNGERNSVPLQNCLLTSGSAVYRTPWSNVTDPIFVPSKGTVLPSCPGPPRPSSVLEAPAPAPAMASPASQGHPVALPHCGGHPGSAQPRSLPSPRGAECESPRTLSGSPNRGPEGISPSEQDPWEPPKGPGGPGGRLDTVDKKDGSQALAFLADGGSPSSRRRLPGTPASLEARRWFRKSYMEALQNPMPLGSSSEESIGDEVCGSRIQGCRTRGPEAATSLAREEPPRPWRAPQQLLSEESGPGAPGGTLPRRSRSWDRTLRGSRDDSRQVPRHSASASPEGLLGGPAMETRPAGSSHPGTAESPSGTSQEADVDAEGSSFGGARPSQHSDVLPEQLCPEGEGRCTGDLLGPVPRQVLEVNQELLQSGVVTLPGTRDRQGRAVVQVCLRGLPWSSEHTSSTELTRLLRYLHTVPRKEVRELGLVILVDARKSLAAPALTQALAALQNTSPPIIHSILLLVDKESAFRPDKDAAIQCELVSSLKALHRLVDSAQLTAALEGSFRYSHGAWISFRRKLEPFTANCEEAIVFLQNSIRSLHAHRTPSTAQEVAELIRKHKAMMRCVLEDVRLVGLRLEGGTVLAWLRREEPGTGCDCRDAIEAASRLYNQVDEEVHRLVLTSNRCLQELEGLQELKVLQEGGDRRCHWEGLQLMAKDLRGTEDGTQDFRRCPSPMAGPAEQREGGQARLAEFCETVSGWTPRRSAPLEHLGPELAAEDLKSCLQEAKRSFPRMSEVVAGGDLWLQTGVHWQEALGEAAPSPGTPPLGRNPLKHEGRPLAPSWTPLGCTGEWAHLLPSLAGQVALCGWEGECLGPGVLAQDPGSTCSSEPMQTPTVHPRKHPTRKVTRKTQSFEIPQLDADHRDSHWLGHTGVFIEGLEVTSAVASEKLPH